MPIRLDPTFDPRRTAILGRFIERWGIVPLAFLAQFADDKYTYAYLGSEDFTIYPLLPPGAFPRVDESWNRVLQKTTFHPFCRNPGRVHLRLRIQWG